MKKKILSFMLAFAFILSVLPAESTAIEVRFPMFSKDRRGIIQVTTDFISKAFSLQVENLEGLDLISKDAKDFEEYVKLRYELNFGSKYKDKSVNLEVEKNEFDFKILEFESRNDDTVDVKIRVVETTKYKGFDNNSKYNEVYRLRLVKEDGAWKVLKAQDGSCYIERFVKPEPERDKKGYEDMQSKIEAHFTRQNFIKSDTEEFLDRLEFNYNEYMKRRVEEEKLIKKEEEMKEQAEVTIKADKEEITDYEEIIEAPEFFYVSFKFDVMREYLIKFKG